MVSYYKIIGGIKYDRSLIELAESLTKGRGDGRISADDAAELFHLASDGYRLTRIEEDTIEYLKEELPWTEAAISKWKALASERKKQNQSINTQIRWVIREAFRLPGLKWEITEKDVKEQSGFANNKLNFKSALGKALRCFLMDETDYESPRNIIREVHGLFPDAADVEAKLLQQTMAYLNEGTIYLIPRFSENMTEAERDNLSFYPPEWGERADDNWLFGLSLPTLSDHLFWAIIDRSDEKAPYCYGFN